MKPRNRILFIVYGVCFLIMTACSSAAETSLPSSTVPGGAATQTKDPGALEETASTTPTLTEPTVTQVPLAARVNGEGIPLAFYESELARFRANSGTGLATYDENKVLQDLIDQVMLAQAAWEAGFLVDEALVEARIQELGLSEPQLKEWMAANGYTPEDFRQAMKWSLAAAWMRDEIIAQVPETADQVHARQILLYNSTEAETAYARLEAGAKFETLAAEFDPVTQGSLGWFPRGYLNVTELDEIVFGLELGAYSPVIQTPLGYHIVQLLERNPERPLTADARRTLQAQALTQWLQTRRSRIEIIILVP